MIIKAKILYKQ